VAQASQMGSSGEFRGAKGIYHQDPCAEACFLAHLPRRQVVSGVLPDLRLFERGASAWPPGIQADLQ
jgi:hypothetical protein